MMELKVSEWKEFRLDRLFSVQLSKGDIKPDNVDVGNVPLVSSGETNNGIVAYLSENGDGRANIFDGNKLTIDMFCHAFYQPDDFFAVSHGRVNVLAPLFNMNLHIGLFIATILNSDGYKYSYGRALYSNVAVNMVLRLPVQHNAAGQPVIDPSQKYSDDGYVPDWDFMEQYMKSLNTQPLVTQRGGGSASPTLGVDWWKEFRLDRLFSIRRGDRIVKNKDYFDEPVDDTYVYPVVTASATDNGVDGLYNRSNCEGHCIVSCGEANGMFTTWQARPFWGMDTVRIYQPIGFTMTEQQGLFFATLLSHNMYRFSYGRKAKPDNMYTLFLRLPIQHDAAGQPVIDPSRKYSDDGYIPDWAFMEQYIGSLPGGDLI